MGIYSKYSELPSGGEAGEPWHLCSTYQTLLWLSFGEQEKKNIHQGGHHSLSKEFWGSQGWWFSGVYEEKQLGKGCPFETWDFPMGQKQGCGKENTNENIFQLWRQCRDGGAFQMGEAKGVTFGGGKRRVFLTFVISKWKYLLGFCLESLASVLNPTALSHSLYKPFTTLLIFLKLGWGHTTCLTKDTQHILIVSIPTHQSQLGFQYLQLQAFPSILPHVTVMYLLYCSTGWLSSH